MDYVLSALEFVSVLAACVTKKLQNSKICIPSWEETLQESNKAVISSNSKQNLKIQCKETVAVQRNIP